MKTLADIQALAAAAVADRSLVLLDAAQADTGWRTISGVHVHIGDGGRIDKGPAALKGKTRGEAHQHVAKHGHDARDEHVRAEKSHNDRKAGKKPFQVEMSEHKVRSVLGRDHPVHTGHHAPELEHAAPRKKPAGTPIAPALTDHKTGEAFKTGDNVIQHHVDGKQYKMVYAGQNKGLHQFVAFESGGKPEIRHADPASRYSLDKPTTAPAAATKAHDEAQDRAHDDARLAEHIHHIGNEADLNDWERGGSGTNTRTHVPADIGRQFHGHGVGTAAGLIGLLRNGVDRSRTFHSEQLSGMPTGVALLRDHQPFMVVGTHGETGPNAFASGIKSVIVDAHHAGAIPAMQKAFPDVKFMRHDEAAAGLSQQAAKKPRASAPAAVPTAPIKEQFVGQHTREQSLLHYRLQRQLGLDVAKPKHGSEMGYRDDAHQKQFEHFLDSEFEAKHGRLDENDHAALKAGGHSFGHDYDAHGDIIGPLIHEATTTAVDDSHAEKVFKSSIERRLLDHHEASGLDEADTDRTGESDDEYGSVGTARNRTFHGKLPGEVKDFLQGRRHLNRLFKVTQDATKAGGADTLGELGVDRYLDAVERIGRGKVGRAIETAKASGDPEMQFLASVHENAAPTPRGEERTSLIHLPTDELLPGHSFTIHGEHFHVDEPEEGHRVLLGPAQYPELPLDAATHIPADKGSLRIRKQSAGSAMTAHVPDDIAPFSAADARARLLELSQGHLFGSSGIGGQAELFKKGKDGKPAAVGTDGHWVTIHGHPVFIRHGESVGHALREHFKGTEKTVTHEHVAGAARQIKRQGSLPHVEPKDLHAAPAAQPAAADRATGVVDTNRQTGLFTKDADGNPAEVGAAPGQASLFGNTAKLPVPPAKPADPDAALRKKFDETATPSMFTPDAPTASPKIVERARHDHPTAKPGTILRTHADADAAVKEIAAYSKIVKSEVKAKLLAGETIPHATTFFHAENADRTGQLATVSTDGLQMKVRLDDGRIVDHHPEMKTVGHDARGYDRYSVPAHVIEHIDRAAAEKAQMTAAAKQADKARVAAKVAAGVPAEAVQAFQKYKGDAEWANRKGDTAARDHIREHGEAIRAGAKARKPDIHPDAQIALTGNTFVHKDKLKASGFKWDGDRRAWVGRHGSTPEMSGVHAEQIGDAPKPAAARTNLSAFQDAAAAVLDIAPALPDDQVHLSADDANDELLTLSAACELRDAVTIGQGLPKQISGLPMHYRWADAAYAGNWTHPTKGTPVPIDAKRIDTWVSNVKKCRAKGMNLPVCLDHQWKDARKTVGEIFDARRNGDRLDLLLGFKGDDALAVGQRNYLSVGVHNNLPDSRGNRYGDAIHHVAVTGVPVIHGQKGLLPD